MKAINVILLPLIVIVVSLFYLYFTHIHTEAFLFVCCMVSLFTVLGGVLSVIEIKRKQLTKERLSSLQSVKLSKVWSL